MNRAVAASLAAVVVGTGLAIGQTGQSKSSAPEEPTPPSSVIRTGPTDRPAFGTKPNEVPKDDEKKPAPKKRTPPPFVIRNGQRLEEPTPPPSVIRKDAPKSVAPKNEEKSDKETKPAPEKESAPPKPAPEKPKLAPKPTPAKIEFPVRPEPLDAGPELKPAPNRPEPVRQPVPTSRSVETQWPEKSSAPKVVEQKPVEPPVNARRSASVPAAGPQLAVPQKASTQSAKVDAEIQFPIRPSKYQEPAPMPPAPPASSPITIGQPTQPPIIPPAPTKEIKPAEKVPEKPAATDKPAENTPVPLPALPTENLTARYPSYATNLIQPHFPWTKMGRRVCGSLYVDTPYVWLDAQYLWGWTKQDHAPALVTQGAVNSASPGALGDPGTTVLYDGQHLQDEPYHGGKFTLGAWLDECQYCGLEGGYFFFASQDRGFIQGANGYPGEPGLFMPYFNPISGVEEAFAIATPGGANGVININSRTRVQGADGHFLFSFARNMAFRMDAIVGVRWLGLDEDLTIEQNIRQGPGNGFVVSSDVAVSDHFGTRNDFIGADLGFKSHFERNCWSLDILTRVALGGNHQTFRGDGTTAVKFDLPDFPVNYTQGGRYIGPANNGIFTNDKFSIVPEVGITLGYMPTNWFKFTVGYNWVYWTDVIRVGAQVDRVVNPIGVPTSNQYQSSIYEPRRPGVAFNESDIWLQSITLGMQFLY